MRRSAMKTRLNERLAKLRPYVADRRAVVTALALVAPIALVLILGWHHRWTSDDGFVNFRVVDQIRAGHGPVFNAGERVEAFTSPLWLGFLLLGDLLIPMRIEWIAVAFGLVLTTAALVFAEVASVRLWRELVGDGPVLPAGVLVLAALPPVWDYATSGLESALAMAWLAASWWALCNFVLRFRREPQSRAAVPLWTCVLIGLGPLVRPDLIVMSAAFVVVLLACQSSISQAARVIAWCVAVPLVYQIFRMAYFAALVPNTALAKEASASNWGQGWTYLLDFVRPYGLVIPLAALIALGFVPLVRGALTARTRVFMVLIASPVIAGVVHATYIVRVGGDFMHGRMLLPSLFCLLLPVGVVVVRTWQWAVAAALAAWFLVCGIALRTDDDLDTFYDFGINNEQQFSREWTERVNPVTIDDWRATTWAKAGFDVRALAADGRRGFLVVGLDPDAALVPLEHPSRTTPIVTGIPNIGAFSYAAGTSVFVLDWFGLSDPLAARTPAIPGNPAGHQKVLSNAWRIARFTAPSRGEPPEVRDARHALECGDLPRLFRATRGPLTLRQIGQNLVDSFALTSLRFPEPPREAARVLCGP